jgi:hypothetical protein
MIKTRNQKSGLFWLAVGLAITFGSVHYGIGNIRAPGPGYVPSLVGVILTLLSGILILRDVHKKERESLSGLFEKNWRAVAFCLGVLLLFTLVLSHLGYILDSLILIYILVRVLGKRSRLVAAITGVLTSLVSYILFSFLLQLQLPLGVLEGLLF